MYMYMHDYTGNVYVQKQCVSSQNRPLSQLFNSPSRKKNLSNELHSSPKQMLQKQFTNYITNCTPFTIQFTLKSYSS